jgi:hypothetical protein
MLGRAMSGALMTISDNFKHPAAWTSLRRSGAGWLSILLLAFLLDSAAAKDLYVSPGTAVGGEGTQGDPWHSIQTALKAAQPGDVIHLAEGVYAQDIKSVRDGTKGNPITIEGPATAVLTGAGANRVVEINHDFITLRGFSIDGKHAPKESMKSYRDKLLYIIGRARGDGVTGLLVTQMHLRNAGGECLRLRYQARDNEVSYSTFERCGVYDFVFHDGGKNGEGVYIGTAPEQLGKWGAPDSAVDRSDRNWIHHNTFNTQGNECVDIKEDSSANIIEYNDCAGQRDKESGGFDSRGDQNVFRYNTVHDTIGAGIRLGGDEEDDGLGNEVYGNTFKNTAAGGLNIQRLDQGKVCENTFERVDPIVMSRNEGGFVPETPCDSPLATAAGRAQNPTLVAKQAPDNAAPLKCTDPTKECLIGRLEGDERSRIKVFDASDVSLRGHHLRVLEARESKDGNKVNLTSLAGKTVQFQFDDIQRKILQDAVLVRIYDGA